MMQTKPDGPKAQPPEMKWSLGAGRAGLATVIVTAFNQDWALAETLKSVAYQTYRPLECVIVNDGSTDNTGAVIDQFIRQHGDGMTIMSIYQPNQGVQVARNVGVEASTGEFIQYLDGDDMLAADKTSAQMEFLLSENGAKCDVVYGDAQWLYGIGDNISYGERFGLMGGADFIASLLNLGKFNVPFCYLCRRVAVERNGRWNSAYKIDEDLDYFLRLGCSAIETGRYIQYKAGISGYYRVHQNQRRSDRGMLLKVENAWNILTSAEERLRRQQLLDEQRRKAFARAYYCLSSWASPLDPVKWRETLDRAITLHPGLMPERLLSRCLRRLLGFRASEEVRRFLRQLRRQTREAGAGAHLTTDEMAPAEKCSSMFARLR